MWLEGKDDGDDVEAVLDDLLEQLGGGSLGNPDPVAVVEKVYCGTCKHCNWHIIVNEGSHCSIHGERKDYVIPGKKDPATCRSQNRNRHCPDWEEAGKLTRAYRWLTTGPRTPFMLIFVVSLIVMAPILLIILFGVK
jgi:hypothetical protein